MLKTSNPNNYRLIRSVFQRYCKEHGLDNPQVYFEHEGFSCSADDRYFRAVDAACPMCLDTDPDYCFNCGRYNKIDFERV
jgi:hypothetical protein